MVCHFSCQKKQFRAPQVLVTDKYFSDDIIKRLAPSLERHRNCDLIDIFPGASLFSSKLHKFLKPRRHILLEPDTKTYQQFLNPLLQSPGSRYHHLKWDPLDLQSYDRLYDEGHLPEQTPAKLKSTDGTNDSLLVFANMPFSNENAFSFLLMRFMESCLDKTLFNRYGLVRVICTVRDIETDAILPREMGQRRRTGILAEAVAKEISLVATSSDTLSHSPLKGMANLQAQQARIAENEKNDGLEAPPGRQFPPIELAPRARGRISYYLERPKHDWHAELAEYQEAYDKKEIARPPSSWSRKQYCDLPQYQEYERYSALLHRLQNESKTEYVIRGALEKEEEVSNREREAVEKIKDPKTTADEATRIVRKVQDFKKEHEESVYSLRMIAIRYQQMLEEKRVFEGKMSGTNQSLLLWDRRRYNPLMLDPEEFFPQSPTAAIDFQPNPDSPILVALRKHTKAGTLDDFYKLSRAFSHVLGTTSIRRTQRVGDFLRILFPGRPMSALISAIPALAPYATYKAFRSMSARERARIAAFRDRGNLNRDGEQIKRDMLSYDESCFDHIMLRELPADLFWKLTEEWYHWPGRPKSEDAIYQAVGGGLTSKVPEVHKRLN